MSTSPSSVPSPLIGKSEYYSSLPWFRRLLAMLNWRPVVDYELREIAFERSECEYNLRMQQLEKEDSLLRKEDSLLRKEDSLLRKEDEQRKIAHEQRMKQLKSENARLAELNAKLSAISSSSATNSSPTNPMPNESEM
jgi:hypothetical protein